MQETWLRARRVGVRLFALCSAGVVSACVHDATDTIPDTPSVYAALSQDGDHDGVLDNRDECPARAVRFVGEQSDNGCPGPAIADRDGDGVFDDRDDCPDDFEDSDGVADLDGCPDPDFPAPPRMALFIPPERSGTF
ncbi:MAG: hypothetical protein IPK60_12235 [Sandaracinaceae bacterium]|jgi:hypothetical protein|nr:hypothetical protein [Sandaracinaceae bacterium]